MPLNLTVRADVIDIRSDQPTFTDSFLVDTNVWLFLAYNRAAQGNHPPFNYQIRKYPTYINNARRAKARVLRCGLSLAEMAHVIEKTEHEIWTRSNATIPVKEYRHNFPDQRKNVVAEVECAWGMIKTISVGLDILLDESLADSALVQFKANPLDGYDLFMLEAGQRAGIVQIITDDSDFATVDGIQVFTCNNQVLDTAQHQGKLLHR